jgi:UPF0755 protein
MNKGIGIALVSLVAVLAAFAAVAYMATFDLGDRIVTVIVKPGDSFSSVATKLADEQVVGSRLVLKFAARVRGVDKQLTPGRYDFVGRNSCRSVLARFEAADFVNVKVTIPEGAPIWMVASILADRMEVDSAEIVSYNKRSDLLKEYALPCLEGYLFPETYFFPWGTKAKDILVDMAAMYFRQTDSIWPAVIPNNLSRADIVVLASIIEAEASIDDEMPTISSVYQNRIRRRMKLDADPTVIYGLGGLDRPLMIRDLKKNTPYNTYMNKGLPPTAINSPGLAAIKAALNPAESDYLFFVADGTGRHRFSKTNAEHNRARREIKRAQSNK